MKGFVNGRSYWPRGKVLGGTGSINGMQITRGSRHDFDRWARYVRDNSWDYNHVLPYFKKLEDMLVLELRNSDYHGKGGPVPVSITDPLPIVDRLLEAGRDTGYTVNPDYNGATQEGISRPQVNVKFGQRWSTSRAYIHPALNRTNLHVSLNSTVTKVQIDGDRTTGIIFIRNGKKTEVKARHEVILSAGTVGSPQILMLSGVGPKEHLEALKNVLGVDLLPSMFTTSVRSVLHKSTSCLQIQVRRDLPVGYNLQDHLFFEVGIKINQSLTLNRHYRTDPANIIKYVINGTGPLASPPYQALAFKSLSNNSSSPPELQLEFPVLLPGTSDGTLGYTPEVLAEMKKRDSAQYGLMCNPTLIRPKSRGRITLRSDDPFDKPIIYANYLSDKDDIDVLIQGIRECEKIVNTSTMQVIGAELTDDTPVSQCSRFTFRSREYMECLVKLRPCSDYHPVGTCKMGPRDDPTAVVDSQLRVHGVRGLRVVDASIMPDIVSGNLQASVIMIAEKVVDLIIKTLN
ncbi:glucose dehydrogenase [FAD, quinone]-like [Physella acuta]|uniref:glucose dehydrogenase [FAD, quinone]-like n=1 Tax=Physella acuta TaxID=109671 RepID=UPI0027DE1DF3|nr:glucose dehydrogenase [FAD, quinone]-like [Physella acuta]